MSSQNQIVDDVDDGKRTEVAEEVSTLQEAPAAVLGEGSLDPVYEAKARILNKAIQDIGMGRYQWQVNSRFQIQLYSANYSAIAFNDGLANI
jgi:hypothetical protein